MDSSIQLDSTNSGFYSERGWIQVEKNSFDSAIADAGRAIKLDPENEEAYTVRGIARYSKDNVAGAVEDFNKAIELIGTNSPMEVAFNQGWLDFIKGDYENAIVSWNKSIGKNNVLWSRLLQPWTEKAKAKLKASEIKAMTETNISPSSTAR
jgi:tetratricopeptide (TPR) repeat protein